MNEMPIKPDMQGKVRDIYDLGDKLLMVATDRISAFDYVLKDEIPYKGEVLTQISLFWFDFLKDIIGNHVISANVQDLPEQFAPYASYLSGRFMIVKKCEMYPCECIVRGYLAGSGLAEYEKSSTVCSIPLPDGLVNSSKLPHPIFTPSTKAQIGSHDENVSFEVIANLVGQDVAANLKEKSIEIYTKACEHAYKQGIIIADTKLEFGSIGQQMVLADEVLTPDSSRFWPADTYAPGKSQPSFDKQFVRDWLSANWNKQGEPPALPQSVIEKTSQKYIQAYELISGKKFVSLSDN